MSNSDDKHLDESTTTNDEVNGEQEEDTEVVHGRNKVGLVILAIAGLLGITHLVRPDLVSGLFDAIWRFIY